jgi:hypothetical protein
MPSESSGPPVTTVLTEDDQAALRPADVVADLRAGNARYVAGELTPRDHRAQRPLAVAGQFPKAAVVSCVDSRVPVESVFDLHQSHPFDALLVNCSIPEAVSAALGRLKGAPVPTGGYANGFTKIPEEYKKPGATVSLLTARTDLGPEAYADFAGGWIENGATIIGGCCEVGPAHIRELSGRFGPDANR